MKTNIHIILFILISFLTNAQNIKTLEEKNGFKNIKLGDNINNYSFLQKENYGSDKFKITIEGKNYEFNNKHSYVADLKTDSKLDKIGDTKVLGIFIGVINERIFEINVITAYDYNLYENFVAIFGKPNNISFLETNYSTWKSNNVSLSLVPNYDERKTFYSITYKNLELEKEYEKFEKEQSEKNNKIKLDKLKNDL